MAGTKQFISPQRRHLACRPIQYIGIPPTFSSPSFPGHYFLQQGNGNSSGTGIIV